MKENIGQDLLEVKAAFDEWRAQRSSHKERIPQHLWVAAISLLDNYSTSKITVYIRLFVDLLKSLHRLILGFANSIKFAEGSPSTWSE